jgi:hypothetical protein
MRRTYATFSQQLAAIPSAHVRRRPRNASPASRSGAVPGRWPRRPGPPRTHRTRPPADPRPASTTPSCPAWRRAGLLAHRPAGWRSRCASADRRRRRHCPGCPPPAAQGWWARPAAGQAREPAAERPPAPGGRRGSAGSGLRRRRTGGRPGSRRSGQAPAGARRCCGARNRPGRDRGTRCLPSGSTLLEAAGIKNRVTDRPPP